MSVVFFFFPSAKISIIIRASPAVPILGMPISTLAIHQIDEIRPVNRPDPIQKSESDPKTFILQKFEQKKIFSKKIK